MKLVSRIFLGLMASMAAISAVATTTTCDPDYPASGYGQWDPYIVSFDGSGSRAVGAGSGMVLLIDASDPEDPRLLFPGSDEGATPSQWPGRVADVALDGRWLLVASYYQLPVRLYDVSDPTRSWPEKSFPESSHATAVALREPLAAVVYEDHGANTLVLYSIGGEGEVTELGRTPVSSSGVVLTGNRAIVSGIGGIDVVDISDSGAPIVTTHSDEEVGPIAATETTLVALQPSHDPQDVVVFDISDPATIQPTGYIQGLYGLESITLAGDRAYVGRWTASSPYTDGHTLVVDLANPSAPAVIGTLDTGPAYGLAIHGERILAAGARYGARLGFLADPTTLEGPPTRLYSRNWSYAHTTHNEGRLFVTASNEGVWILDTSNPYRLTEIGNGPLGPELFGGVTPWALTADGARLWAQGATGSLYLVDVSDPGHPSSVTSFPVAVSAVVADDGIAAVSSNNQIQLIDAHDPAAPQLAAVIPRDGGNSDSPEMALTGSSLAVSLYDRLEIYDVSDPWDPRLAATITPDQTGPNGFNQHFSHVHAGDGEIFVFTCCSWYVSVAACRLDVSDPWATSITESSFPSGYLFASEGRLLAASEQAYLSGDNILDVLYDRQPDPIALGWFIPAAASPWSSLATDGYRVFWTGDAYQHGLQVISLADCILQPIFLGDFESGDLQQWTSTTTNTDG